MPRVYKHSGEKRYTKYTDEKIAAALQELRNGLSYRKCTTMFGIPLGVLHRHFKASQKGKQMKHQGGQTVLSADVEKQIASRLVTCSVWGYPLDIYDLRVIVKSYLDRRGIKVQKFKQNMPGNEFAKSFLQRHKALLSERLCQNIKRSRAEVSPVIINQYFDNLEETLVGVPPENIINYDETNLTDDPGKSKVVMKRGTKYPERILNSSKASTSLMFACTGAGEVLPPYVVYKAIHMYDTWTIDGPVGTRYNRSISGWFDAKCFEDWLLSVVIPFVKNLPGKKILIGDNLSSHLTVEGIRLCEKYDVAFVFLPKNSTHLTQPLDVSFFRPLKAAWRKLLLEWKKKGGRLATSVPKEAFPCLLKKLMNSIKENQENNVKAGFDKCGIIPLNRERVLNRLPQEDELAVNNNTNDKEAVDDSILSVLKELRYGGNQPTKPTRRRRINVTPGKSVKGLDFVVSDEEESLIDDCVGLPMVTSPEIKTGQAAHTTNTPRVQPTRNTRVQAVRNETRLAGVYTKQQFSEGDWIVADFSNQNSVKQSSSKQSLFIGSVIDINNENEINATFTKFHPTKIDSGKIFKWPDVEDICTISIDAIIGVVDHPNLLRRGLMKFSNINFNVW